MMGPAGFEPASPGRRLFGELASLRSFTGGSFTGGSFTGGSFTGGSFTGESFTGESFTGGSFTGGASPASGHAIPFGASETGRRRPFRGTPQRGYGPCSLRAGLFRTLTQVLRRLSRFGHGPTRLVFYDSRDDGISQEFGRTGPAVLPSDAQ
jgi:hypothetical protein